MPSFLFSRNSAAELTEMIINYLQLKDICSLRLVARDICDNASTDAFQSCCRRKRVKLSIDQLQHATLVMQGNHYSYLLEHLTLVAIPVSQDQKSSRDLSRLLQELLETIYLNSTRGHLPKLTLSFDYAGQDSTERLSIWKAAGECFDATILALASSKLPIEYLDIFGSIARCSLACDQITETISKINKTQLAESLSGLKTLCLSLSQHECDSEGHKSLEFGRKQTGAICNLLQLCPNLNELRLHWYQSTPSGGASDAWIEERHFFGRITESCRLLLLERLTLEGIYTTEAALLSFLKHVRLRSLVMDEIYLTDNGSFRPCFNYILEHMRHAELHFDNFWENRLIEFDGPGNPHFPSSGRGPSWPNFIVRTGQELSRRPIGYRKTRGVALGSAACSNWVSGRHLKYGPWSRNRSWV